MSVRKVSDKHDPKQGVGISFEDNIHYYDEDDDKWKEKTVTMTTICEEPREVDLEIQTWTHLLGYAKHWYITLRVANLSAKCDDPDSTSTHSSNRYPEETKGFVHRVKTECKMDMTDYDITTGERYIRYKKGDMIDAFTSEKAAKKQAIEDFKKYFGDGWVLVRKWTGEKVEY